MILFFFEPLAHHLYLLLLKSNYLLPIFMLAGSKAQIVAIGPERIAVPPIYLLHIHAHSLKMLPQFLHRFIALEEDGSTVLDLLFFFLEAQSEPQLVVPNMVVLGVSIQQIVQKFSFSVIEAHAAACLRICLNNLLLVCPYLVLFGIEREQAVREENLLFYIWQGVLL